MSVSPIPKIKPGTKQEPIEYLFESDDDQDEGQDSEISWPGEPQLEEEEISEYELSDAEPSARRQGSKKQTYHKPGYEYRQPVNLEFQEDVRDHPEFQRHYDKVEKSIAARIEGKNKSELQRHLATYMDKEILWAVASREQPEGTRNAARSGGPCACCVQSDVDCIVQVECDASAPSGYKVTHRCMACMASGRACNMVLRPQHWKRKAPTELVPSPARTKRKPAGAAHTPGSRTGTRHGRRAAELDEARLSSPPSPRLTEDTRPSHPEAISQPSRTAAPASDLNPQLPSARQPQADSAELAANLTAEADTTTREILTCVTNLEGFTKRMRELRSEESEMLFDAQAMFDMAEEEIAKLRKVASSDRVTRREGYEVEVLCAVEEVGEFIQHLRSEVFGSTAEGHVVSYPIKAMFKKIDGQMSILRRILRAGR